MRQPLGADIAKLFNIVLKLKNVIMGSSKKKGQQRKAAAKKASLSAAAEGSVSSGGSVSSDGSNSNIAGGNSNQSKIIAKIRRGNNYATKRLTSGVEEGFLYEESGVLSAILDFFNRCEDETFDGVMNSVGGDLKVSFVMDVYSCKS